MVKKPRSALRGFDTFWSAYPRKKNKGDAQRAWKTAKIEEMLLPRLIMAVEVAKRGKDWKKDGGQFIPYPGTWIRARGWEDEPDAVEAGPDHAAIAAREKATAQRLMNDSIARMSKGVRA